MRAVIVASVETITAYTHLGWTRPVMESGLLDVVIEEVEVEWWTSCP